MIWLDYYASTQGKSNCHGNMSYKTWVRMERKTSAFLLGNNQNKVFVIAPVRIYQTKC